MKNYTKILLLLFCAPLFFTSCSEWIETEKVDIEVPVVMNQLRERDIKKWAEERNLQKEADLSVEEWNKKVAKMYDAYYENLRAYKKSKHKIVYGWFGGWSATEGLNQTWLTHLPDSVDVVSIWGGTSAFDEKDPRYADLKYAQEVKGLKVLLCWQTGTSGLGLPGGVEKFNERHEGKTSVQKAVAYAQELTEFIKKHNFNGYDIDWEPNVGNHGGGCHNLYENCPTKKYNDNPENSSLPIKAFIQEMGKNFGPQQTTDYNPRNTGTLFFFDGELIDMSDRFPEMGKYFDYFLEQNYGSTEARSQYLRNCARIEGWSREKHIICSEFEKNANDGGICGKNCAAQKANGILRQGLGGFGAYHIELDPNYRNTRQVIRILNPRELYNNFLP
ncbi:glycoside hydrolase family 18 [Ornithobacterium rhinotracheale]